jgi:hypothetical protein
VHRICCRRSASRQHEQLDWLRWRNTGVYLDTNEQLAAIRQMIEPIYVGGGSVLCVQLT